MRPFRRSATPKGPPEYNGRIKNEEVDLVSECIPDTDSKKQDQNKNGVSRL